MTTATDRFMDALCSHLPSLSDEDRVRLEDAFIEAVTERVDWLLDCERRKED